jgi:hypothetical protein
MPPYLPESAWKTSLSPVHALWRISLTPVLAGWIELAMKGPSKPKRMRNKMITTKKVNTFSMLFAIELPFRGAI